MRKSAFFHVPDFSKMLKKLVGLVLTLLLVWAAYLYISEPVFWHRYVNTFRSSGMGASSPVFDFRATVRASDRYLVLHEASEPAIAPEALKSMVEYAQAFDSFALIVLHEGRIELEWYRDDYSRDSLTQSQSMHKSLQALLVGIAVEQGLIGNIDDRIGDYIEELNKDERGDTTIRDYLQMSTGLMPFEGQFSPFGDAFRWLYDTELDEATLAIPQVRAPGDSI